MMSRVLFIIFVAGISLGACNTRGNLTRSLTYIDILDDENSAFHQYPNELTTQLLSAILGGDLNAYDIDYLNTGNISDLSLEEFKVRASEPYELFVQVPSVDDKSDTLEHSWKEYFSNASLISIDELWIEGNLHRQLYLNFYHPAEISLEGFNKYICSLEFEAAMDHLKEHPSGAVWHNYTLRKWGWVNGKVFKGNIETSSALATDLLAYILHKKDSSLLAEDLSLTYVENILSQEEYNILASYPDQNLRGSIFLRTESTSQPLATYSFDILNSVASETYQLSQPGILPIPKALIDRDYTPMREAVVISENGVFNSPLSGRDELTARSGRNRNIDPGPFDSEAVFYFREVNRLFDTSDFPSETSNLIYEWIRKGDLVIYQDDTLIRRQQPGEFFDAMIYEDLQSRINIDPRVLQIYLLIWETHFTQDGNILQQIPLGIGLVVPGKFVPEGFNREAGFFKLSDVNALLKDNNNSEINLSNLNRGFPLKSWNIQLSRSPNL